MKKVLFIPTYSYLSTPIFERVVPLLKGIETIYIDSEDQFGESRSTDEFKQIFTHVISLPLISRKYSKLKKVNKILNIISYKKRFLSIIHSNLPDMIITTSDLILNIRILKDYYPDIPIVVIQPGVLTIKEKVSLQHRFLYYFFNKILQIPVLHRQNTFGQEYNDIHLLLWGEYFKQVVSKKNKTGIIGNIALDRLFVKTFKIEIPIINQLPQSKGKILLCIGAFRGLIDLKIEKKLNQVYIELIQSRQDLIFIIKPHPRDPKNDVTDFIKRENPSNAFISNHSIYDLFQLVDVHISSFSGTALEAMAFNIPTISVNPENQIQLNDFFNKVLNITVSNIEDLNEMINAYITDPEYFFKEKRKAIENVLYKLDGKAAERCVKIIQEIIQEENLREEN